MTLGKKSIVVYWETRRVAFLVLALAGFRFSWAISNGMNAGVDDLPAARYSDIRLSQYFAEFFVGNAIFSLGYVAEYFFAGRSYWPKIWRTVVMLALLIFGCLHISGFATDASDLISLRRAVWPSYYQKNKEPNPERSERNAGATSPSTSESTPDVDHP